MTDNIFMISDASYSKTTKCAGLGVIDLYSNKKYSQSLQEVENSYSTEYRAVLFSVSIALKNNYKNVVFAYDNKSLDLESLKIWLKGKIDVFQFLWLRRSYVKDADKIARKARKVQEQLHINKPQQIPTVKKTKKKRMAFNKLKNDQKVIEAIRYYNPKKIAKFCLTIASDEEKKLVNNYLNGKKSTEYTPTKSGVDTLMFLCYLFPKKMRRDFFLYVKNRMQGKEYQSRATRKRPMPFYVKRLHKIIDKLQKGKNHGK